MSLSSIATKYLIDEYMLLRNSFRLCHRGSNILLAVGKYAWLCHNHLYLSIAKLCDLLSNGKL